jgi:hypothetical protein
MPMKVALCFIISYEHILQKEQLWIDWIKPNQDIINIYFHYKNFNFIKSTWIKKHAIPKQFTQNTTYYNVVPAYMSILSYAYEDEDNNWFCLLTESCIPIISPKKFREMFINHCQASIIKCKPAYWNIFLHQRANLRLIPKELRLANDPWFTLCRTHVKKCLLFLLNKPKIYNLINDGGLANESIFAIILQSFNELTNPIKCINESSNICDWKRMSTPTSPYVFKDASSENINIICNLLKENKYTMFLRKVQTSFPDSVIKDIMNADFRHTYNTLHNKVNKKQSSFCFYTIGYFALSFLITVFITEYFMNTYFFTNNM